MDEGTWQRSSFDAWGRIDVLQRLASEVAASTTDPASGADRRWVSAVTLGFTHWTDLNRGLEFGFGTSLTMDLIPNDWATHYGSRTPLTARFILQLRGKGHWTH